MTQRRVTAFGLACAVSCACAAAAALSGGEASAIDGRDLELASSYAAAAGYSWQDTVSGKTVMGARALAAFVYTSAPGGSFTCPERE
jgi:hypothetical protein